jgi:hypothetical protein
MDFLQMDRVYNIDETWHSFWQKTANSSTTSATATTTTFIDTADFLNRSFLYFFLPFGLFTNLVQFFLYTFKIDFFLPSFYMSHISISNMILLTLYSFNILRIGQYQTTMAAYSAWTCKLQAYAIHVLTGFNIWLLFLLHSDLNEYIQTSDEMKLKKRVFRKVSAVLVMLALVYSIDLFSIEMFRFEIHLARNYSLIPTRSIQHVCFIENRTVLIVRDLIDFFISFLIPQIPSCFKIFSFAQHLKEVLNQRARFLHPDVSVRTPSVRAIFMKLLCAPFFYSFFVLPPLVFTLLHHFFYAIEYEAHYLKYLFVVWTLLNQIHWSIFLLINILFDKNLREFFYIKCMKSKNERRSSSQMTNRII